MKLDLDSHAMTLTCPGCGKKFDEKIGRPKHDPKITCPGCKNIIAIDADKLRSGIQSAEKSLDDFRRKLRNLGK